jgi:DNA-binding MarR family transcriptional regulator
MHAISFQLKRAHLVTTAFGQRAVKRIEGMTPARYDVVALLRQKSIRVGMPKQNKINALGQRTIVARLGLHPSTVSKMLKRMEAMGWIRRYRDTEGDKRVNVVELTELGLRRAWRAMRTVYRNRLLLKPFERIAREMRPQMHVLDGLTSIWDDIDGIARFFNDRSDFTYSHGPWRRHYQFPDARDPDAWEFLACATRRAPRTSWPRYLRKLEWRHSPRCMRHHMLTGPCVVLRACERAGDACFAGREAATSSTACRVSQAARAVGKGEARYCRRRFTKPCVKKAKPPPAA